MDASPERDKTWVDTSYDRSWISFVVLPSTSVKPSKATELNSLVFTSPSVSITKPVFSEVDALKFSSRRLPSKFNLASGEDVPIPTFPSLKIPE